MKYIPLTKGKFALVNDEDFEYLNQWKWCYLNNPNGYAIRAIYPNKHQKIIYMHRFLLKAPKSKQVDHINGNSLDNQRLNLRLCYSYQNQSNQIRKKISFSGYKGVTYNSTIHNKG